MQMKMAWLLIQSVKVNKGAVADVPISQHEGGVVSVPVGLSKERGMASVLITWRTCVLLCSAVHMEKVCRKRCALCVTTLKAKEQWPFCLSVK